MKMKTMPAVRVAISFPPVPNETLQDIAKEDEVSLAWVVPDAAARYVACRTITAGEQTTRA